MFRSILRYLFGWASPPKGPSCDTLFVFPHTSYFDIVILWLYSDAFPNLQTLVRPLSIKLPRQCLGMYLSCLEALGLVEAADRNTPNSGTTETLIEELRSRKLKYRLCTASDGPLYFLMSPKGTIAPAEWRSGYKYIAKGLDMQIAPILLDYERRSIELGASKHWKCLDETMLKGQLGTVIPLRPENSEIAIPKDYDPYELLFPFDIVLVSMYSALPVVYMMFQNGHTVLSLIALCSTLISIVYHNSHERMLKELDAKLGLLNIVASILGSPQWTASFFLSFCIAMVFYYVGTPRHACTASDKRGRYVVYHSLFHCFASLSAYYLFSN